MIMTEKGKTPQGKGKGQQPKRPADWAPGFFSDYGGPGIILDPPKRGGNTKKSAQKKK